MEYVSIGAANSPETLRGSATRGKMDARGGRDSGAMIFSGVDAIVVAGAENGRSGGDSLESRER